MEILLDGFPIFLGEVQLHCEPNWGDLAHDQIRRAPGVLTEPEEDRLSCLGLQTLQNLIESLL